MAIDFQRTFMKNLPRVNEQWKKVLPKLVDRLLEVDYTVAAVNPIFTASSLSSREIKKIPGYLYNCRQLGGPLETLVPYFLLRRSVPHKALKEVLGSELVDCLVSCNLAFQEGDQIESVYDLYPCYGTYVFTDPMFQRHVEVSPLSTYYLGNDSYALTQVAPRKPIRRALDLCTGSGVHAVMAARHSSLVMGVDINPRALSVCELNAILNGVDEKTMFLHGDLYAPINKGGFDLITANPPFIPSPEKNMELFRGGGESGEEITQRIFAGLADYLAPGGTLALVTNYPLLRDSNVLDRHLTWLSQKGWGLALMHFGVMTREQYILMQQRTTDDLYADFAEMEKWLELYDRLGLESIGFGVFLGRKLEPEEPSWTEFMNFPGGEKVLSPETSRWFESLCLCNGSEFSQKWQELRFRPAPMRGWWRNQLGQESRVELQHEEWPTVDLDGAQTALLAKISEQPGEAGRDYDQGPDILRELVKKQVIVGVEA